MHTGSFEHAGSTVWFMMLSSSPRISTARLGPYVPTSRGSTTAASSVGLSLINHSGSPELGLVTFEMFVKLGKSWKSTFVIATALRDSACK